jgi:hypothetical protein
MRNKLGIGLAIGLAVLALAVLAVIPALAQSILPILPPPGECWGPTPPPGWHGKPPIWLPQIIICNFPLPPGFLNALQECSAMGGHALYMTNNYLACLLPNGSVTNIPLQ